ncbi:hypothetical protein HanPSC8_Chr09g0397801 [Helianthus annuus]|nr:hypothetical protein HanPSC8_Chr09g0397801 [Helianthus annuus]
MRLTLDLLPNARVDKVEPFHLRHGIQEVDSCEAAPSMQISCIKLNTRTSLHPKVKITFPEVSQCQPWPAIFQK